MKYSILVIDSSNAYDYWEDVADGVEYDNLKKEELDILAELSLKHGFSIVIKKYEEEE